MATHPNRLIHETSPYLLQHAHNPVDWYPWGQAALARAVSEDKPILLSIGYAACHWCHVMAHESFEDPEIAALMNAHFVNIKVDREERPDLDAIYMEAVQAMTGGGGWPMTMFLAPNGKPFYGGTYFPPVEGMGMPSFRQVLLAVADAWRERRQELLHAGERIVEILHRSAMITASDTSLTSGLLDRATANLLQSYDRIEGGFGRAPKFPQPMVLDFLLQSYRSGQNREVLDAVTLTLIRMAHGGLYDQLGGGFHRYSTDAQWLVPHFEKMLYDNAQLARTYLHAWQITGDSEFRRVVEETLDYILREMTSPEGGFYSTQDADSEGEEGRYYLWTAEQVEELLGPEDARLFNAYYDVTPVGNFHEMRGAPEDGHGKNILHVARATQTVARSLGVSAASLEQTLARGRETLLAVRQRRVSPARDEKVLAEWNGLMVAAFAEAGAALSRADYTAAAAKAGRFILERLTLPADGAESRDSLPGEGQFRLKRSYKEGQARIVGYLEDYAAVALGMLGLYQATFDLVWLKAASGMAGTIVDIFFDAASGGFFQAGREHEQLVARRKDFVDSAIPSGNSLAAELFLRLGKLLGRAEYAGYAVGVLQMMADAVGEQPAAFSRLLCALDFYLHPGHEIAIVGDPLGADTRSLLAEVWKRFQPNSVLALLQPGDEVAPAFVPLLAGRTMRQGQATAYVCRDYTCKLPVCTPADLARELGG